MMQLTLRYSAIYFSVGVLLVLLSSYIALSISAYTSSLLLPELTRGIFLLVSFSLLFYQLSLRANKKMSENISQYKRLFEENPNPMWVYDLASYKIMAVNQAALQTYGYSREEFLHLSLMELRPKSEAQKLLGNLKLESPHLL